MPGVSLVQMIDGAGLFDHIAGGVIQIRVEFRFFQDGGRLALKESDLFGDDREFTAGDATRPFVGLLHLRCQGHQIVGVCLLVRTRGRNELNAARIGVGLHERERGGGCRC